MVFNAFIAHYKPTFKILFMDRSFVIGIDYGTDSVRSVLVDVSSGVEVSSSVFYYPRWKAGKYCQAVNSQYRQHPLDYLEGLESTIKDCLEKSSIADIGNMVTAISVDTTGSTPIAVNQDGVPLGMLDEFKDNPNAMFILWKDHMAIKEANELNEHAEKYPINYLKYVGGVYSSEWYWAKLLHILRKDEAVRQATFSWVEHCDYIPFVLTGGSDARQLKRGVCSAGHKALFASEFGGVPPKDFFTDWDPLLAPILDHIFTETYTAAESAGTLSPEWAYRLGLNEQVKIGIGAFDCHMGAVGGQIEPYHLSKVMGTSTCDIVVVPKDEVGDTLVRGICGQVDGSVIPGMLGMEAGQSAFGDAYAWFKKLLMWPLDFMVSKSDLLSTETIESLKEEYESNLLIQLSAKAEELEINLDSEFAIDWFNGRRTPDANQELKGAIGGLGLGSDAPRIFRSIVEATCFGAKSIVDRFESEGIPIKGLIALGGVAKKSPFIMQMMADVMNAPIKVHKSEQTCALGAAMFAATVAGHYASVEDAMHAMGQGFEKTYQPNPQKVPIYAKRYNRYKELGGFLESFTSKN